jgi:hypothetical protein
MSPLSICTSAHRHPPGKADRISPLQAVTRGTRCGGVRSVRAPRPELCRAGQFDGTRSPLAMSPSDHIDPTIHRVPETGDRGRRTRNRWAAVSAVRQGHAALPARTAITHIVSDACADGPRQPTHDCSEPQRWRLETFDRGVVLRDTYRSGSPSEAPAGGQRFRSRARAGCRGGWSLLKALDLATRIVDARVAWSVPGEGGIVTALLRSIRTNRSRCSDLRTVRARRGCLYFVMGEYLDGVDLRTAGAKGPLDVQRVAATPVSPESPAPSRRPTKPGWSTSESESRRTSCSSRRGGVESDFVRFSTSGLLKVMHRRDLSVTKPDQILGTAGYMPPRTDPWWSHRRSLDAVCPGGHGLRAAGRTSSVHGRRLGRDCCERLSTWIPPRLSRVVTWPADHVSAVLSRGLGEATRRSLSERHGLRTRVPRGGRLGHAPAHSVGNAADQSPLSEARTVGGYFPESARRRPVGRP